MKRQLRGIVYGNAAVIVTAVIYFLILPAGILAHALADPGLRRGTIPRFTFHWHRSLSKRIEPWARNRVTSGRAGNLGVENVSGTEWPVFSSVFYLWATEALQEEWQRNPSSAPVAPAQYAGGAIAAVAALVADPGHGTWVKKWWGDDYLRHDNLFYRMLLISGLTSYQKLSKDDRYEALLRDQVNDLSSEIEASSFGLLDDYPGQCYPVDVLTAIAAIQRADAVLGTDHAAFVRQALRGFEETRLDSETGLPAWTADSKTGTGQGSARGVGLAFMLSWAPELWPEVARQWSERYENHFWQEGRLFAGLREYPKGDVNAKKWLYDVDAGPVLGGYGTAASGFGIGAARANGSFGHAYVLSAQALIASWPLPNGRLLLPRLLSNLSDAPFTGESALLFSLTRLPKGNETQAGGALPLSVYLGLSLYLGSALLWLAATAYRVRRWEQVFLAAQVPAPAWQFSFWLFCIGAGVVAILSGRAVLACFLLLAAQLLPGIRSRNRRGLQCGPRGLTQSPADHIA